MGVPVILDLIISPPWQSGCNLGPPISETSMEINDQLFFRFSKEASLQVGAEIVGPTEPATLATAAKPSELRDSSPATLAIRENEVDELLILLGCPWPFLNAKFVTARLPSHPNTSLLVQIKRHQNTK